MHTVITNNIYSIKALERASSICTTCISLIRFACFKVAIEKEIPIVVLGMSPGQAPVVTSVVKTNPEMVRKMQDAISHFERTLNDSEGIFKENHWLTDNCHTEIGYIYYILGDLNNAEEKFNTVLQIGITVNNLETQAVAYGNLGIVYRIRGELDKAVEMYEKSLKLNEELGTILDRE